MRRGGALLRSLLRGVTVPGGVTSTRPLSDYVYRMRMLDYYAQNDAAVINEFPRSQLILMLDKRALVREDEYGNIRLLTLPFEELKRRLAEWGFVLNLSNSVFLDLQPSSRTTLEGVGEYEGLFGTSLQSVALPEGSPVSIDKIRSEMAASFDGRFMDLRKAMLVMTSEEERNRLAKLHTISSWSTTYRRCPSCGGALRKRESKTAAECAPCKRIFYPTFSPVAITLIRDPTDEHALLVRHRGSVNGVYTCVAGFALTGESLAQCAKREVAEEVGIEASSVNMLNASQPWPMPESSLMVGHEAVADMHQKIQVCPDELETARWFSRAEVGEALQRTRDDPFLKNLPRSPERRNDFVFIPPQGAIAHRLIRAWHERSPEPVIEGQRLC